MPNIKAAEKWARQSEKRTLRNRDTKSRLKTVYRKAVAAGDAAAIPAVESEFDRAAKRGIIHKNKAARKKSRLAKAIAHAATAPAKPVKAKRAKAPAKTASKRAAPKKSATA